MRLPWNLAFCAMVVLCGWDAYAFWTKVLPLDPENLPIDILSGQVLMVGFKGDTLTPELESHLSQIRPGGIILFKRNITSLEQIQALTASLQNLATKIGIPPFLIAVDQEGGAVTRIKSIPMLPSAMALGNAGDFSLAYKVGLLVGDLLSRLGINMNLAPVADIGSKTEPSFIGTRSFGETAPRVARMVLAYSQGLLASGVIPTAKHFPGHGSSSRDSHVEIPVRDVHWDELLEHDLVPFFALKQALSLPALLVAHVAFPKLDPASRPATFSMPVLHHLLRERLGYSGVTISDDLEMAGVASVGSYSKRVCLAISSGIDLAMIGWNRRGQLESWREVRSLVSSSPDFRTAVLKATSRVLALKQKFLRGLKDSDSIATPAVSVRDPVHNSKQEEFYSTIHQVVVSNVNLAAKNRRFLPFRKGDSLVIASPSIQFIEDLSAHAPELQTVGLMLTSKTRLEDFLEYLDAYPDSRWLFHVTGPTSANLLNLFPAKSQKKVIIVNTMNPSIVGANTDYEDLLNVFTPYIFLGRLIGPILTQRRFAWAK